MGSHPYFYFTPYQSDIGAALQELRREEFEAGRYDPALRMSDLGDDGPTYMFEFEFPPTAQSVAPGARHATIGEALDAAAESGTGSILDIVGVSKRPQWFHASPLPGKTLDKLFGTERPSRKRLEAVLFGEDAPAEVNVDDLFWDPIERGQARYIVTYEGGVPDQIFFLGFSVD